MVQREVGERLRRRARRPPAYGVPSVLAQLACEVQVLRPVSRTVFRPVPNVDSVLLGLRRVGPGADARLRALVHAAFAHRRKALAGSLALAAGGRPRASASAPARRSSSSATRPTSAPSGWRRRSSRSWPRGWRREAATRTRPGKVNLCLFLGPDPRRRPPRARDAVRVGLAGRRADAHARRGPARRGASAPASRARTWSPSARRRCARAAGTRRRCGSRSASGSRSPPGWAAARPTPRRCCGCAARLAPVRRGGARARRRRARRRRPEPARPGPRLGTGAGEIVEPLRRRSSPRRARPAAAVRAVDRRGLPRGRPARARPRDRGAGSWHGRCAAAARAAARGRCARAARQRPRAGGAVAVPRRSPARSTRAREPGPTRRSCAARDRRWSGSSGARTRRARAPTRGGWRSRFRERSPCAGPRRGRRLGAERVIEVRNLRQRRRPRARSASVSAQSGVNAVSNQSVTYLVGACLRRVRPRRVLRARARAGDHRLPPPARARRGGDPVPVRARGAGRVSASCSGALIVFEWPRLF